MTDLPPGWATDLAVLEHGGSDITDRGDHLVVHTPQNPTFHWGNFLLVHDREAVDDAARWVAAFGREFPAATWTTIGLVRPPTDPRPWAEHGLAVELDDVLTTRELPRQTPVADGYTVRRLTADEEWEASIILALAENARTDEHEPAGYEQFQRARVAARRRLCDRGVAAFFGAFRGAGPDTALAADLGIVVCGRRARYQDVGTDAAHRRRGLASHLLGVAARWAAERGCEEWVILTEATNPAGRVYRAVGFEPDVGNAQAYRAPPRHPGEAPT